MTAPGRTAGKGGTGGRIGGDRTGRPRAPARAAPALPRPGVARRLHRGGGAGWIGWLLAVLIVPVALSGTLLAVWPAVERVAYPTRFAATRAIDPDACVTALHAGAPPDRRIVAMERGAGVLRFTTRGGDGGDRLFACTARGASVSVADATHGAEAWVRRVHAALAVPWVGRGLVAAAGLALIGLALSGLALWGVAVFRGSDGWAWHRWLGLAAALPVLAMAASGMPMLWRGAAADGGAVPLAHPAQPLRIVEAHALALTGGTVARVAWPTRRSPDWLVTIAAGTARQVKVADDTGGALAAVARSDGGGTGEGVAASLHGVRGTGWWRRMLLALTGLAVVVLVATGLRIRRGAA